MPTRRYVLAAGAAGILSAATGIVPQARAQTVKKPVHVIVGFPAGGGTDIIARILADRLRGTYASTVLVENKPGAAARLSVEYVKNAEPDGSVMLFTPDFPITVYPHSFRSLNYDPLRDFTPVAPAARSMLTYNVGAGVPESVKTLAEFVAWCKANPAKASYGTTAAGGTPHFVGVMLANEAGIPMTAGALSRRRAGAAGSGRRPRLGQHQSDQREHGVRQGGDDPDSGGDRFAAFVVPARGPDHARSRLQRGRGILARRILAGEDARGDRRRP